MSIKGTFEMILHVESLTNIEIPHQGLFAIEAQLYEERNGTRNHAIPYRILDNTYKTSSKARGKADINDMYFRTKIGYVRYSDQTVELNDIVQLKLQLDAFPSLSDRTVYLEFSLLFASRYYFDEADIQNFQATAIQKCRFKLQSLDSGIFHYCEGQFIENYLSKFSFTFFSMLVDYKFAGYKCLKPQPTPKEKQREKVSDLDSFAKWLKAYYQNCQNPAQFLYEKYVKTLSSHSYHFRGLANSVLKGEKDINLKVSKHFMDKEKVTDKMYFEYLTKFKAPKNLNCQDIRVQISQLHTDNFFFVQEIINAFAKDELLKGKMKEKYDNFMKEKFGQKVFKSISYGQPPNNLRQHEEIAKVMRKKDIILTEYPIIDVSLFLKKDTQILGFYEITLPESSKEIVKEIQKSHTSLASQKTLAQLTILLKQKPEKPYDQRKMLFVLCHGFQGSSYDMMMIQRGIRHALPLANMLVSMTNELDTERDIGDMGSRLAKEVISYIQKHFEDQEQLVLNFVGHSMGGVIARASFKYLTKYENQLGIFCTLGSPHLGYLSGTDGMIKTGLWFLNKWKKIPSLEQLSMGDSQTLKETFMYRLSKQGSLKKFKKIILISSMEDSFAPWNSVRICAHRNPSSYTKLEKEMIVNLLGNCPVHRIDIHFNTKRNDLDGFIGRKAHIHLIVEDNLFKLINWTIPSLFDLREL